MPWRRAAGRGQGAAGGSGGVGCAVVRSGVVVGDRGAVAPGVRADGQVGVEGGPPDDRDGDLYPVDGAQAALSVGVSDVGGGGVGLDSSAPLLPDLVDRAGPGRVEPRRVDQADRGGDRVRVDTRADRQAAREKRFRPRAVRIDSTVVEADVRYPTDAGLASSGVRVLAREGLELAKLIGEQRRWVRIVRGRWAASAGDHPDDPPPVGGGEGRGAEADRETGGLLERSVKEARRLAQVARRKARGRGARSEAQGGRCGWRRWRIGARRSPGRSASVSRASRSRTGSSRCSIRTPGRSARASSGSPTCADSATIPRRARGGAERLGLPGFLGVILAGVSA